VGFDGSPLAARTRPPLTTVGQPLREKAASAVTSLVGVLAARRPSEPDRVLLPTSLVVRESTAPPRG
jgi:DNA-binding LacI/PurR family transcriptional regulator